MKNIHCLRVVILLIGHALAAPSAMAGAQAGGQELLERLEQVTKEDYPDSDAVVVLDDTRVEVEDSGLSHVSRHRVVKVFTEKGAAELATLRLYYDPASSHAEVKAVIIYRVGGDMQVLPQDQVLDLPQPQAMIYWGPRMKLVPIPRLAPGDAVGFETYSKGFVIAYLGDNPEDERYIPPMRGHYYDVVLFQEDLPLVEKRYTISLPFDKPLRAEVFNGTLRSSMTFDDAHRTYSWWTEKVPAVVREPRMIEDSDAVPKLVLATVRDWPEKSRWFYQVNEDAGAFEWNEAIEQKVLEITRGLKGDDAKRKALLAWVAREIRYSGISMGEGEGYTLHPATMTFNDRAGVCKDIAGMLITMFRVAGYTTYPAMTMAGARVEDLPADQFNHCVVAVDTGDGAYKLYDPTWCPMSAEVWSSAEKPQHYVIGNPDGQELMQTPEAPPSDNLLQVLSEGKLNADGDLAGTLTITGGGYSETGLRWAKVYQPAYAFEGTVRLWLSKISPRAVLEGLETTDVTDVDTPFRVKIEYSVSSYAMVGDGVLAFVPPSAHNILDYRRFTDFVPPTRSDSRAHDIFLRSTREIRYEETLSLPGRYHLEAAPELKKVDGPFASFRSTMSTEGRKLRSSRRLEVKKKIIPASGHANLKEAVDAHNSLGDEIVVLSR